MHFTSFHDVIDDMSRFMEPNMVKNTTGVLNTTSPLSLCWWPSAYDSGKICGLSKILAKFCSCVILMFGVAYQI